MRTLCLALLLSLAGKAATVIPVVTASIPNFNGPGHQTDEERTTVVVGPGGAVVDFNFTLEVGYPLFAFGDGYTAIYAAYFSPFIQMTVYGPGKGFDLNPNSACYERTFCSFTIPNVALPVPGPFVAIAVVDIESNGGETQGGLASLSLTVDNGDIYIAPEPRTWPLSGLGLLIAGLAIRHGARGGLA